MLADCLESIRTDLQALEKRGTEVWVVDNASTDDSVLMLQTRFPEVKLIENDKNVGFATANNQAIRQSTGQFVLLLNPDTLVKPQAIVRLINFLAANPTVGAVGAHILNADESLQTSSYPAPTLSRELWRLFHLDNLWPYSSYRMATWRLDEPHQVDSLLGACILLRRQVLEQVELFDEGYFMFSEEIDLCYRIKKAGWSIFWLPEARVIHYGGQSTQQAATAMFLSLYRGKLIYFRKNQGWLASQIYKLILLGASLFRLMLNPLARLIRPHQRQQYSSLAECYWQLVLALPGW
jgi:hypothetical protein